MDYIVINLLNTNIKRTVIVVNRTKIKEGILLDFEKIVKIVIISYFKDN